MSIQCQATINDKEGRTHQAQASLDLNMPLGEKTLSPCLVKVGRQIPWLPASTVKKLMMHDESAWINVGL